MGAMGNGTYPWIQGLFLDKGLRLQTHGFATSHPPNTKTFVPVLYMYIEFRSFCILQQWNDYQLKWDPSEFGEIKAIRILSHKVWKPDIVLFNKWE